MSLLKGLWGWLTQASRGGVRKGHPDLNPYDVKKLVEELNLRSEARRLGEAGVPSPDATRPGGAEAEAIQRVDRVRQDYVDWAVTRLTVLNELLAKSDITQSVNRARLADQEFERKASSLISERDSNLRTSGEKARQLDAQLVAFKAEHRLDRRAVYPSGARAFLGYALLLFLVVVEGLLNAAFFAQGLDSGLLGGAAYAMSLALLNVAVAYGLGRWPSRYINHRGVGLKILGWMALILAAACMVAVGLAIAHFRDALTAGSTSAPSEALQALLTTPWHLKDLMSWGLFGLSVSFALIAFFDGLFSDDLYPGYGNVSRAAESSAADYDEQLQGLRAELDELRQEELKLLDEASREAQGSVARYASLIGDKKAARLRLETALQDAANALEAVLAIFRQENQVARGGLAIPNYFHQPAQLAPLTYPDFDTSADEKRLAEQRALAASLTADIEETRARMQAAYTQKFDLLQPLQTHFAADGNKP